MNDQLEGQQATRKQGKYDVKQGNSRRRKLQARKRVGELEEANLADNQRSN